MTPYDYVMNNRQAYEELVLAVRNIHAKTSYVLHFRLFGILTPTLEAIAHVRKALYLTYKEFTDRGELPPWENISELSILRDAMKQPDRFINCPT